MQSFNDIAKKQYNFNASGNGGLKDPRQIDIEAARIIQKLGADDSIKPFVCKVLGLLPPARVHELAEIASEKATKSVPRYFTTIAAKDTGLGRWKNEDR